MKKFFEIIDILVGTINKTMAVVGLSLGVLLAFVNVILRYVFDMSLTWAGELTNYFFIWSALFGAAYGFKQGIHISVTLLIGIFPPFIGKLFVLFAHFITITYLTVISYFGYQLVLMLIDFEEVSVDLQIPMWIPHLVLPIAFGLAAYRVAEKIYEISKMDSKDVIKNNEHELIINEVVNSKGVK